MSQEITLITREAEQKMSQFLSIYKAQIYGVLPKGMDAKRIGYLVLNQISKNPALAGCTPMSFINSVLLAGNLGLEIRQNSAYLVPYGKECQLLIDYRGKIGIAAASGVTIDSPILVREGDTFRYGYSHTGLFFEWEPSYGPEEREIIGSFAFATNHLGHRIMVPMRLAEIERIRARSKNGCAKEFDYYGHAKPGLSLAEIRAMVDVPKWYRLPWVTDYDQMAKKTTVHRLFNSIPQTGQMSLSQEIDVSVETGKEQPLAAGMLDVLPLVDPAHDRPMVDGGGETREEQKAARETVKKAKVALASIKKEPSIHERIVSEVNRVGRSAFFGVIGNHGFAAVNEITDNAAIAILADLQALDQATEEVSK